jgi:hypothetical protein
MAVNFFGNITHGIQESLRGWKLQGRLASMFIPLSRLRGLDNGVVASQGLAPSKGARPGIQDG